MNEWPVVFTKPMVASLFCKRCGRYRGLIGGLCDDCTITEHGELFPWLKKP